jgi:glycosyltransferase involved in cell wall biosynthesis
MAIDFMRDPAPIPQFDAEQPITKLLHLIWTSRPDLQAAFDLSTREGHDAFRSWAREGVKREYGVDPSSFGDAASDGAQESARAKPGLLSGLKALFLGRSRIKPSSGLPGATLIGYTHGVLGMGEHVRMSAEALSTANVPFGVLDIDTGDRPDALTGAYPVVRTNGFRANIFHVNADQMLPTYCRLGSAFYANRYNIGFWAWELAKWPALWEPVLEMVDEVWAPSKFIQDCLKSATDKPVVHMPLCVELPPFQKLPRSRFGLPEGSCLFLFAFDFNSYIERKNPFAAIRAFKSAFPAGTESAGLVVKVMKADETSIRWREMMDLIGGDARIHVINEVMSRGEVLALIDACDCFVSLHRSEGFGRGPAEAMYLGKPVIVTAYSGNMDFTRAGASLLVDYKLIPVGAGDYVFGEDQVWADVDVEQAASQMRHVHQGSSGIAEIAARGQSIIRTEFSNGAIGLNMERRLAELGLIQG